MRCYHHQYAEQYLTEGKEYQTRGFKKEYQLIEVLADDEKYHWFNVNRFKGGESNATYWSDLRLGYGTGTLSKLESYPSGNYAKWYYHQNGTEC